MPMPSGIEIIDLMLGIPTEQPIDWYDSVVTGTPHVPLRDHVWPKYLRENAVRVFKL